jgi:hypothetical protein
MITLVDGFEKRVHVSFGPGLPRGCHQHEWQPCTLQALGEQVVQAGTIERDDPAFDGSPDLREVFDEGRDDGLGSLQRQFRKQDDANPGAGKWVSSGVGPEGIVKGLRVGVGCRHFGVGRLR